MNLKSSAFLPSSHFYIIRIYFNPFSKGERFIKARFRYLQLIKYFNEFISLFSNTLKQQNFFRIPKFNNNSFNYLDRSSRSRQSIARLNSFTSLLLVTNKRIERISSIPNPPWINSTNPNPAEITLCCEKKLACPTHTHTLKPTKQPRVQLPARLLQNPSSLSSSNSPAQRKKNSALSEGRRTLQGRISTKTTTTAKQRRCERHGYDSPGSVYTTHPPQRDFYVLFPRGVVCA